MANRLKRRDREHGYTLIEVMVAMGIFSVFLALFIAGVVTVSRASTQAKLDAQTSSAIGAALQRIERSTRYADAINRPGTVGDNAYVEWRTDASSARSGATTCTQLRYDAEAGTIAMRAWNVAQAPSTGAWSVLVTQVRGEATDTYPFAMVLAADGVSNYQGLTAHIIAGLDDDAGTEVTTTVYAKNSSVNSSSNAVAANGQSVTPVCAGRDYRP